MFVDTQVRPQGEQVDAIAPSRMKLSEAIRKGRSAIIEERSWYGCALCAACHGTGLPISISGPGVRYQGSNVIFRHLKERTTASDELLQSISRRHFMGESSAALIDWLEAQGL